MASPLFIFGRCVTSPLHPATSSLAHGLGFAETWECRGVELNGSVVSLGSNFTLQAMGSRRMLTIESFHAWS